MSQQTPPHPFLKTSKGRRCGICGFGRKASIHDAPRPTDKPIGMGDPLPGAVPPRPTEPAGSFTGEVREFLHEVMHMANRHPAAPFGDVWSVEQLVDRIAALTEREAPE